MHYDISTKDILGGYMNNPEGPYPGRQLFLGMTESKNPCFAYLITGRSPESRERKAVQIDSSIRIGPLGNTPYDPLRHYNAIKYDNVSGIATVSNGIQTEAIFETYRLLFNTASVPSPEYMEKIMEGAKAEPDSYHTPRIAGIITGSRVNPVFIIGIKAQDLPVKTIQITSRQGTITGISTYKGSLDNPEARDPSATLPEIEFTGRSADELATYLFNISTESYKGNDIRVCAIGGIRADNLFWNISIINAHKA
jgi:IMP cyclohydrolase